MTDPSINRDEHADDGGIKAKRTKGYTWNSATLAWEKQTTDFQAHQASSATPDRVAVSTTSAILRSANASRKMLTIVNDTTAVLYVKYGTTASTTSYIHKMQPDDTLIEDTYTGRVDAILSAGTGNVQVNEL